MILQFSGLICEMVSDSFFENLEFDDEVKCELVLSLLRERMCSYRLSDLVWKLLIQKNSHNCPEGLF